MQLITPRGVAQLVEHWSPKPGVAGSSPVSPANEKRSASAGRFSFTESDWVLRHSSFTQQRCECRRFFRARTRAEACFEHATAAERSDPVSPANHKHCDVHQNLCYDIWMRKYISLYLFLAAAQIAFFISTQYVYYTISSSCTVENDWYCSSNAAANLGRFITLGSTLLVPPFLAWLVVKKVKLCISWTHIALTHVFAFATLCIAILLYLLLTTHPTGA